MNVRTDRAGAVWTLLVVATFVTWWLGADHRLVGQNLRVTAALALLIAFVKVRLVGRYFMGVRGSTPALRLLFDAWLLAVGTTTITLVLS